MNDNNTGNIPDIKADSTGNAAAAGTSQTTALKPLLGLDPAGLRQVAAEVGLPAYAAGQMAQWLYQRRVTDIDQMTNLSKKARRLLAEHYCTGREAPLTRVNSADGTVKYLFSGCGRRDIESVMIPDRDRATLCISSQAGCRMGCRFCMTGRGGYQGNLTAAQIINQILSVDNSLELTNIVFMGMGEPADNIQAVLRTIDILTAPWGLGWSPKRITVSSVGYLPGLKALLDQTRVHIAISAHSPYAQERQALMPIERAHPLQQVMQLLKGYDFAHQRRLSLEYIMWQGLNDDLKHADALARLMRGTSARVNLIRFHAIPDCDLRPTGMARMEAFRDHLNQAGITATIRASRGEDIMAACGMLAGRKNQPTSDQSHES